MNDIRPCLIEELRKLKESSKEAVENIEAFSAFKQYMHVKRKVEDELLELIKKSSDSYKSQLILVCGGVGDGKSHLISFLKKMNPQLIDNFYLHNDATESFDPLKTSMDTLNDVLIDFSDENLVKNSCKKIILAINLGALSNFIDSDYNIKFKRLRDYVINKGILESGVSVDFYDDTSSFQYINLSDYHMYSLTEDGAKSEYMKQLLVKITGANQNNIFYNAYHQSCMSSCICADRCPIKFNFEFMSSDKNQKELIQILIEGIIKHKLIISTRAFLNFIYDIIVCNYLDGIGTNNQMSDHIQKITDCEYISFLTPNLLFEHESLSNIFEILSKLDPLNMRNEKLDSLIIKVNATENVLQLYDTYIDMRDYSTLIDIIVDEIIAEDGDFKNIVIKFFVRLYKFNPKIYDINLSDETYCKYVKNLYIWNKNAKIDLKELYNSIKDAIYKWNGDSDINSINMFIGKNQLKYKISQKHQLEPHLTNLMVASENELFRFIPFLILHFHKDEKSKSYAINIDYALYDLLIKIRNGYRPNKKDKENFINFVEFIDKILILGDQDKELMFEEKLSDKIGKFRLKYDKSFNEYCFTEI